MSIPLIALGVALLLPAAWVLAALVGWLVYWLLASNAIDYLVIPALVLATAGGAWALLVGLGVLR